MIPICNTPNHDRRNGPTARLLSRARWVAASPENAWTDSLPVTMLYAMFGSGGMNVLDEPAIFAPI
jgi:hypothetical protein